MFDIIVITPDRERNKFESDTPEAEYFRGLQLGDISDLHGFEGRVKRITQDYEATMYVLSEA